MTKQYTDDILKAAYEADFAEWSKEEHGGNTPPVEASVKAILDAIAPLIAAKALRDFADEWGRSLVPVADIYASADEIEDKA